METTGGPVVRIGVLGAARITGAALIGPAARVHGVEVTTVAARDRSRAERHARRRRVPRVLDTYDEVVQDPDIDAVYIPLPAGLHGVWAGRAIAAGKHVLVEKPFTANAEEAAAVVELARRSRSVVMEAHHTSHHPFTTRVATLVSSGVLGTLRSARGWFHVPIPPGRDIRWNAGLGGGAMMDVGCYPLRMLRDVLGEVRVEHAAASRRGDIDRRMTAIYDVAGIRATLDCGIWSAAGVGGGFEVVGTRATLRVRSPFHPQLFGRVRIDGPEVRIRESAERTSSYLHQLAAFRDAIASGETGGAERAVGTMRAIDETYRAAGMQPREPTGSLWW